MNPTEHKSETPETDAAEWSWEQVSDNGCPSEPNWVPASSARKLEVERNQSQSNNERNARMLAKTLIERDQAQRRLDDAESELHDLGLERSSLLVALDAHDLNEALLAIQHLRARVEELEKDKERLDWLEDRDKTYWVQIKTQPSGEIWLDGQGPQVRQAIDAAMKGEKS